MRNIGAFFILTIVTLAGSGAHAAVFCVSDAGTLAAALDIADNNGQSDTIQLQQAVYSGGFVYNANAAEGGDLTIEGGYTPGCGARVRNASNTVLDGNSNARTLLISGRNNSDFSLDAVTIQQGRAQLGGAGLDVDRFNQVEISSNVFAGNQTQSGFDGSGGVNIDRTVSADILDNVFENNSGGKGGALSLSDLVVANIHRNSFLTNSAEQGGGGLDADTAGSMVITDNVFAHNSALEDGAGMTLKLFVDTTVGSADLTNNTVTDNSAGQEGGGVDLKMIGDAVSVSMYNNIVWNNSAGLLGRDIYIDNDDEQNGVPSPVVLLNNDFDPSFAGLFIEIPFPVDASNLNNVDPMFIGMSADNFRLQSGSLVIDAGNNGAPHLAATDNDGAGRVSGAAPDIGAFEFQFADSDGDAVDDSVDNCTLAGNPDQRDTNMDGFGNACDPDLNNDNDVNFLDLGLMKSVFFTTGDLDADLNGDGDVNFVDLAIMKDLFFGPPGPGALAP